MTGDERFKTMDKKTARVINAVTESKLELEESEEEVNMCRAIAEMREDERREGREEGREEGIEVFILDNLEENVPENRILEKLQRRFKLEENAAKEYFAKYAFAEQN